MQYIKYCDIYITNNHIKNMIKMLKYPINYKKLEKHFTKNENFTEKEFKQLFIFMKKYIYTIYCKKKLYVLKYPITVKTVILNYIKHNNELLIQQINDYINNESISEDELKAHENLDEQTLQELKDIIDNPKYD